LNILQLYYFLAIAKYGSISKASEQLFIGQPTLSASIHSLEKELDVKLFFRSRKGCELTEYGQIMLPVIKNIAREYDFLKSVSESKDVHKPQIHVAHNPSSADFLIQHIIKKYHEKYPNISIFLKEYFSGDVIKQIQRNTASIGLSAISQKGINQACVFAQQHNITIKTLNKTDELVLWCPKDHQFANRDSVSFYELQHIPFALSEGRLPPHSLTGKTSDYKNFTNIICFSTNENAKKAILYNGMCGIFPKSVAQSDFHVQQGDMKIIPLTNHDIKLISFLCYRQDAVFSQVENEILEEIVQFYGGYTEDY